MNAGAFLLQKLIQTSLYGTAVYGSVIGLGIGMVLYVVSTQWIGFGWGVIAYGVTAAALLITPWVMEKRGHLWNVGNLAKGVAGETLVGQVIERAITAEHCAVAHSVTKIAKVGDIDHIVATPKAVWVIETKYKWVPSDQFEEALKRIAANTRTVRRWLPKGTLVQGCLVLAFFGGVPGKPVFVADGENITVFYSKKSLLKRWGKEAQAPLLLDKAIAKKIWSLNPL